MSSQTNTLTEGPLAKQIFLVSLPLALSNLLVARFYGARHPKDVEKTVHSAAIISAVAGVVLLLIGLLGSPAMLRLLHGGGPCGEAAGKIHLTVTADDSVQKRLTILIREAEGGISKSR